MVLLQININSLKRFKNCFYQSKNRLDICCRTYTYVYFTFKTSWADSTIRDIFHPLFDKYDVDLVFSVDNHNYQRTFPLKYNSNADSSNPIIVDRNQTNYNRRLSRTNLSNNWTAGRSHYDIEQQAPFVANQNDDQYGFLNIDINTNNTSH